ncbi:hypothetical protein C8F04DRAFT_1194490 [Mycena alexandri]|uniref:Uncharacterized protein n=1 Tax=Mycena alexandri TaxID=1745969 RepID=A0AAD6S9B2_9AGAR|nr:hypothetical protein C8F04DRAFT_1194490 [Mycena alexandri]
MGGHHGGKGGHFTLLRTLSVEVVYLVVYRGHHEGNGGHFTLLRTLRVEVVYLVVYRGHHEGKGGRKHRSGGVSGGVWGTPWGMGHAVGTCGVWGTPHDLSRQSVGTRGGWCTRVDIPLVHAVYGVHRTTWVDIPLVRAVDGVHRVWGTAEFQGRQNVGMRGSTARAKASSPKSMSTVGIEPTPPPQEPKGCYHYTMRTLQQCPSST